MNHIVIAIVFLSFKETNNAYLLWISKTYSKDQIPLLGLLINCISDTSALLILTLKDSYILCLLNFIIIDLRNSSANCLLSQSKLGLITLPLRPASDIL